MWRKTKDIVLTPWRMGRPGKALVFTDGSVVACCDDSRGEPHHEEIRRACGKREGVVASLGIASNGLATAYTNACELGWLAAVLNEHDPALVLDDTDVYEFGP